MTAPFGKASGGGRRGNVRQATSLLASLSTLSSFYQASLVDLSSTGARLKGIRLPEPGEEGSLQIGRLKLFGEVRWSGGYDCGFAFSEPLTPYQMAALVRAFRLQKEDADLHEARQKWSTERLR